MVKHDDTKAGRTLEQKAVTLVKLAQERGHEAAQILGELIEEWKR